MNDKITLSFARLLKQLLEQEVNRGDFRASQGILERFIEDGVLDYRMKGRQQQKVFCPDAVNLRLYLHNKFGVPSLEEYILFLEAESFQRSDAVRVSSDSKIRKTRILKGFLVNAYDPIEARLNGDHFPIIPNRGAYTFISDYEKFVVPGDTTIVVVENYENFREIERQRYLFHGLKPLFLWRYQNTTSITEWLKLNRCEYVHFGDFDLKGVHIYLSEFKSKLEDGRGRFLIPDNIEHLMTSNGARFLYEDQKSILPAIMNYERDEETDRLIELIRSHKKGLSQEILIV